MGVCWVKIDIAEEDHFMSSSKVLDTLHICIIEPIKKSKPFFQPGLVVPHGCIFIVLPMRTNTKFIHEQ